MSIEDRELMRADLLHALRAGHEVAVGPRRCMCRLSGSISSGWSVEQGGVYVWSQHGTSTTGYRWQRFCSTTDLDDQEVVGRLMVLLDPKREYVIKDVTISRPPVKAIHHKNTEPARK